MGFGQIAPKSLAPPATKELDAPQFDTSASKTLSAAHRKGVPRNGAAASGGSEAATHAEGSILEGPDKVPLRGRPAVEAWEQGQVLIRRAPRPAVWELALEEGPLVGQGVHHAVSKRGSCAATAVVSPRGAHRLRICFGRWQVPSDPKVRLTMSTAKFNQGSSRTRELSLSAKERHA